MASHGSHVLAILVNRPGQLIGQPGRFGSVSGQFAFDDADQDLLVARAPRVRVLAGFNLLGKFQLRDHAAHRRDGRFGVLGNGVDRLAGAEVGMYWALARGRATSSRGVIKLGWAAHMGSPHLWSTPWSSVAQSGSEKGSSETKFGVRKRWAS